MGVSTVYESAGSGCVSVWYGSLQEKRCPMIGRFITQFCVLAVLFACRGESSESPAGSADGRETGAQDSAATTMSDGTGDVNYPIQVSVSDGNMPYPSFQGLEGVVASVVAAQKGEAPRSVSAPENPCWSIVTCIAPDIYHWIAKVRVLEGPVAISDADPSGYPVGGGLVQFGVWRERRHYRVEIVEVWLGKPSRTDYQLWDIGGYCPGDLQYCPPGTKSAEECLRIQGEMPHAGTCEYHHPETGELLVLISGLDMPSGLEPGAEFILFGADAIEGLAENGLWATLKGMGADPAKSTLTGAERLLYRTEGDQVDVIYLVGEDFPGSPGGYMGYAGPRWVPVRLLARRILDRIVLPYLADHPEDKPFVEAALSGLLLEEYLFPTPEEPEEPALTSCPEDGVASAGRRCKGVFTCHSGQVTCCGEAYSRETCVCNKDGAPKDVFECAVLDDSSCFAGACPPTPCMRDEDCPSGSRCFPVVNPMGDAVYLCVPAA